METIKLTRSSSKYRNQLLATLIVNIPAFIQGFGTGWTAPFLALLQSDQTPLDRLITTQEFSWIGSMVFLGCILGNIFFGTILDKIGRKFSILIIVVPQIAFWITIILANEVHHYYLGRFLGGISGGGIQVCVPIFVAEMASNEVRGLLGSMMLLVCNIATLLGYIMATYVSYEIVGFVQISLCLIHMTLVYLFLVETPQYLLKKADVTGALKSLKIYRNFKTDKQLTDELKSQSKENATELDQFYKEKELSPREALDLEFEHMRNAAICQNDNPSLSDFVNKSSIKALMTGIGLMCLYQIAGGYTFVSYATTIFKKSYTDIDANTSTIILGVTLICGAYLSVRLVDKLGRKLLLIVSTSGIIFFMLCGGMYQMFYASFMDNVNVTWIPTVTICGVVLFGSSGLYTNTFVVIVEHLPGKIRSMGTMICMMVLNLSGAVMLKSFPILLDYFNLQIILFSSAVFCIMGLVFIVFCVKETKGKPLDQNN